MSWAGSNFCKSTSRAVSGDLGTRRMLAERTVRSFGRWTVLDVKGLGNQDARLLSLESTTPRTRTYADRLSENSREVTLVAEAALGGHIR